MSKKIILFLLAGTVIFFILLRIQGKTITQPYAPAGIVSMEFAATKAAIQQIMDGYKMDALVSVLRINILIDFLFIPFYTFFFYTLSGNIACAFHGATQRFGSIIAFSALAAGLFDICENLLMLFSSYGIYSSTIGLLTSLFAGIKFVILALNMVFILIAGPLLLFRAK